MNKDTDHTRQTIRHGNLARAKHRDKSPAHLTGSLRGESGVEVVSHREERAGDIFGSHPIVLGKDFLQQFARGLMDEIGVIGSKEDPRTKTLIREIHRSYLPNRILNLKDPAETYEAGWFPFLTDKGTPKVPTAFICRKSTCLPPATDESELRRILS